MSDRTSHSPGIRYVSYLFGPSGYGAEARTAVIGLLRGGYDIRVKVLGRPRDRLRILAPITRLALAGLTSDPTSDSLHRRPVIDLQHLPPDSLHFEPGFRARIARTMVEGEGLPAEWLAKCRTFDELWVPSAASAAVFLEAGLAASRIRVIPIGVDTDLFRPRTQTRGGDRNEFRFLSIFNWEWRKGWDILLRAYLAEFRASDEVSLTLKAHPLPLGHVGVEKALWTFIQEHRRSAADVPRITLIQRVLSETMMASLYRSCDAFVLPTRGEAWGRPFLEAMATALPVIGTGWGGNIDFMSPANSLLIRVEGLEPAPETARSLAGVNRLLAGNLWARPSLEHLRRLMRYLFENPKVGQELGRRAREETVLRWDAAVTGEHLRREIQRHTTSL